MSPLDARFDCWHTSKFGRKPIIAWLWDRKQSFFFFFNIGVQLTTIYKIDNSVLVQVYSKVNHLYPLFQIIFPYNSLQSIECYTVGPYLLSILYIVVCVCVCVCMCVCTHALTCVSL